MEVDSRVGAAPELEESVVVDMDMELLLSEVVLLSEEEEVEEADRC